MILNVPRVFCRYQLGVCPTSHRNIGARTGSKPTQEPNEQAPLKMDGQLVVDGLCCAAQLAGSQSGGLPCLSRQKSSVICSSSPTTLMRTSAITKKRTEGRLLDSCVNPFANTHKKMTHWCFFSFCLIWWPCSCTLSKTTLGSVARNMKFGRGVEHEWSRQNVSCLKIHSEFGILIWTSPF